MATCLSGKVSRSLLCGCNEIASFYYWVSHTHIVILIIKAIATLVCVIISWLFVLKYILRSVCVFPLFVCVCVCNP